METGKLKKVEFGKLVPGSWSVQTGDKGEWAVFVMCLNGHIGSLIDHSIDEQGRVFPSLVCPESDKGCDFHIHATLDEWDSPAYNLA
jgi:hypothetical protein